MPPQVKANRRGLAEGVQTVLANDSSRLWFVTIHQKLLSKLGTLWWDVVMSVYVVNMKWNQNLFLSALPNCVFVAFKNHVGDLWTFLCMSEDFCGIYYSLFYSYSVAQLNTWPLRWWKPLMKKLASTISAVTCGASASSSTSCWVDTRPLWVAVEQTAVGIGESPAKPARYTTHVIFWEIIQYRKYWKLKSFWRIVVWKTQ